MTVAPTAIPDGWRAARLGDVADIQTGGTPSRSEPGYWGGEVPWMASGEINQRSVVSTAESITEAGVKNSNARVFPAGTVMIAMNGQGTTRGKAGVLGIEAACNQSLAAVSGCRSDNGFLFHVLDSSYERLRRLTGDGRNGLNLTLLRQLQLLLPPLPEQRAIAAVLDSIDEAIELTDEVIAATERLRNALTHELLTRGLPGRHSEWREIPGVGTVPACWDVVRLEDVGRWLSGGTPSKVRADYWHGKIPWISPKDMKAREIHKAEDHISEEGAKAGSRVVPAGTILVVVRGMILAHSFPLAVSGVVAAFNQDIRALVCDDSFVPEFVLAALEHQKPRLSHLPTPSTHGTMRVVSEELFAVPIPRPPLPEQRAIAAMLHRADAAIEGARAERDALQSMKASTADALLSGRVRISAAAEPDTSKAINVLESRMNRSEVLRTLRAHQAALAEQFGVTGLTLFGSVARDQATDASDIDILAEFASAPGWREYFGAQAYLEAVLGRPVDLMTAAEVRPEIRPYVERDAINV